MTVAPDEMVYGDGTLTPADRVSPGARKLASEIAQAITEDGYGITIVTGVPLLNNDAELLIAQMIDPLFTDCMRLRRDAETASSEYGWVIERGDSEVSAPKYWAAGQRDPERTSAWTSNHMHAIRFARELDAKRLAERTMSGLPYRICEHQWG